MYFCHIENFAYGENNERSFSNPHSRMKQQLKMLNVSTALLSRIDCRIYVVTYHY